MAINSAVVLISICVGAQPDPAVIETLRAGYAQWQTDVCFKGHFQWRQASFENSDDVDLDSWDWQKVSGDRIRRAGGLIAKRENWLRIRFEPEANPEFQPVPGGVTVPEQQRASMRMLTNVGYDEITDGRLHMGRHGEKTRKVLVDDLNILSRNFSPIRRWPPWCTFTSVSLLTPVRPVTLGESSDPFEMEREKRPNETGYFERIAIDDSGNYQIELHLQCEGVDGKRTLIFSGDDPSSLLSLSNWSSFPDPATGERRESGFEARFLDFQLVDGLKVPSRIRWMYMSRPGGGGVTELHFPDPGLAEATHDDFVYPVPAKARLGGIRNTEVVRERGRIDLSEISEGDLVDLSGAGNAAGAKEADAPRIRWLWPSLAGVAVLSAAGVAYMRRLK
ncbi:hypothetical protein GC176_13820 [bacterium]|nr:hypothetical protein [bacterium]